MGSIYMDQIYGEVADPEIQLPWFAHPGVNVTRNHHPQREIHKSIVSQPQHKNGIVLVAQNLEFPAQYLLRVPLVRDTCGV